MTSRLKPQDGFQSTLSVRRATRQISLAYPFKRISIHALREESDLRHVQRDHAAEISIHALREESDSCCKADSLDMSNFNPRSP